MKVTSAILRAGLLALGVAAFAAPGLAQTGAGTGGPSNTETGSNQNLQATPGTPSTGGTYAPGSSSGGRSGSGMSGTTGSGMGGGSGVTGRPGDSVGTGGPSNTPTGR
jgi:hypothetical protein